MSRGDIDHSAGRADMARGPGGAEPTMEESAAAAAVLRLIWGTHMARAVYVMAKLGIADLVADAPLTAAQLAQATQAHEPSLYRVLRLLACRRAMANDGRVLIIERLIPDDPADAVPVLLSDLTMLIVTGGQERTNAEYRQLLAEAGLKLAKVQPVASPYGVIEGLAP
jgi:hypothetical protein